MMIEENKLLQARYNQAVEVIKTAILQSQYDAAKNVNRIQLALYYGIGKYLSINTRKRAWGSSALQSISDKLHKDLPGLRGFSATQLKEMRLFYEGWDVLDVNSSVTTDELENISSEEVNVNRRIDENYIDVYDVMQISGVRNFPMEDFFKVPFTHHSRILAKVKDMDARCYYIHRTAEEHLSVERLKALIDSHAYEHRAAIPNNFPRTLSDAEMARKAVMMFKDEYLLDFINVEEIGERESIDVDERVVEQQIISSIKKFIMTFGTDFAFIGNQYHLEVYGKDFFPDLLFFNRELNAMVVVELKTGDFKTSYLAQLMTYLRILDDKVRKSHENPSIGIVLCKNADKEFVEYIIQDYDKPMGVATYATSADMPEKLRKALPDVEELKKLL